MKLPPISTLLFTELAATIRQCILSPLFHTLLAGADGSVECALAVTHLLCYWPEGGREEWFLYSTAFLGDILLESMCLFSVTAVSEYSITFQDWKASP